MRKYLVVFLCVCAFFAFSVSALASQEDYECYEQEYSIPKPLQEDYESEDAYLAAFNTWFSGFNAFVTQKLQEEAARQAPPTSVETVPVTSAESAGAENGVSNQTVADNSESKYPLGSYVDPDGVVWSPDGTRLSPAPALDAAQSEDAPLPFSAPAALSTLEDSDTLAVIASLVSDIAADSPTWYVEDLRPSDVPGTALEGLKSLVTSIFGEYAPITTTSVITETIGNETHQYLVETVASGAAGVDYEWLAGVFLFGILLFCFMKLLGGVLK